MKSFLCLSILAAGIASSASGEMVTLNSPFFQAPIVTVQPVDRTAKDTLRIAEIDQGRTAAIRTAEQLPNRDQRLGQIEDAEVASFDQFLLDNPRSPWSASLFSVVGKAHRDRGRYSLALIYWESSWLLTGDAVDGPAKAVADFTLVHWTQLLASLGRLETLKALIAANRDRIFTYGWESQMWAITCEAVSKMERHPEIAYKCGTYALNNVAFELYGANYPRLVLASSPETGFTFADLQSFSDDNMLGLQVVFRQQGSEIVVPSVVHWKEYHYAAIIAKHGEVYEVIDPTFGGISMISAETINAEASGYFMISQKTLPAGWRSVEPPESSQIMGRGYPWAFFDLNDQAPSCPAPVGSGGEDSSSTGTIQAADATQKPCSACGSGQPGMPFWKVSEPYLNLWVYDTPLSYQPSYGPKVELSLTFKQRKEFTYSGIGYSTLGSGWNASWLSYIDASDLIRNGIGKVVVYMPGGGAATLSTTVANQATTPANYFNNKYLNIYRDVSLNVIGFDLVSPDGSKLVYTFRNTAVVSYGYFLTAIVDPQGNQITLAYDTNPAIAHVKTLTDVDGKVTSLYYADANFTDLITSVSDSYGRTVTFASSDHSNLTSIQDCVGITTTINYDVNAIPSQMITPYGTTAFNWDYSGTIQNPIVDRSITIRDPDGSKQVYSFFDFGPPAIGLPTTYSASEIPNTTLALGTLDKLGRDDRSSYYWNAGQAASLSSTNVNNFTVNDYLRGRQRRWLGGSAGGHDEVHIDTVSTEQAPSPDGVTAGQITWYDYEGKDAMLPQVQGTQVLPGVIARVQPDGSTWYVYYQRNALGAITNQIESWTNNAVGYTRTNIFLYSASGMDLIYQRGPSDDANHTQIGYFYDSAHSLLRMTNAVKEVTTYTYDASHRLSTRTLPSGLMSTYSYYPTLNFLSNVVDSSSGPIRTNLYTWQNGMIRTLKDERGLLTTYSFDLLNRPTTTVYPDGTGETNLYAVGATPILDRTASYDRLGNKTSYVWDSLRRMSYITNANSAITAYGYCSCGGISSITRGLGSPAQNLITYGYDQAGRRTNAVLGDNTSVTNVYDSLGRLTIARDALGNTTNVFDNLGRLTSMGNASGQIRKSVYDLDNRVTNSTDPNGVVITITYDSLGRIRTRTAPDGGVEAYGYTTNIVGVASYTNQLGKIWYYGYDVDGRKTNEVATNIYTQSFTYSPAGDLLTLADGKSQITKWGYDPYGRVASRTNQASVEILRYKYDAAGELTNRWSKQKLDTFYAYDKVGNLTNVDYQASVDIRYQYDALNRLINMVDASGTNSYTYNGADKLLTEVSPWATDTLTYSYNTAGIRASMSIQQPTGNFTNGYKYDAGLRLTNLTSTAGAFSYYYHPGVDGGTDGTRLVRRLSLPNTSFITNFYDSSGRLTETDLKNNLGVITNQHAYLYNLGNQRTKQNLTDSSYRSYLYDGIGQVTSSRTTNSAGSEVAAERIGYKYDAALNLNFRTNNVTLGTFTVDTQNQLTATPASASYIYDNNGNLTRIHDIADYAYDDENELTNIVDSNNLFKTDFIYDGKQRLRKRIEYSWSGTVWSVSSETRYIYDGMTVVQERDSANNPTVTYTRGTDLSGARQGAGGIGGLLARSSGYSAGSWSTHNVYHADGNGNVTFLINSSQSIAASYKYDPFGNLVSSTGSFASANVYGFSSKELHAKSGLYYYGYRWYDPNSQRWLNRDPLGEKGFDLLGTSHVRVFGDATNPYRFVGNNGINFVDVDGRGLCDCAKALAELTKATLKLEQRVLEAGLDRLGIGFDDGHAQAMNEAINRVNNAMRSVAQNCAGPASVAAALAAAGAAIEAALPFLEMSWPILIAI